MACCTSNTHPFLECTWKIFDDCRCLDCWYNKQGYLGMMVHWIDIENGTEKWSLWDEVVGFCLIHGTHMGSNLGHYFVSVCDCVGVMLHSQSKVHLWLLGYVLLYPWSFDLALYCDTRQHFIKQHFLWDYWIPAWILPAAYLVCSWKPAPMSTIKCSFVVRTDYHAGVLNMLSTWQMLTSWPISWNWLLSKPPALSGNMTPLNQTTVCLVAA